MISQQLSIKSIERYANTPKSGDVDSLKFAPGLNIIHGGPNTGKSQWLTIIDYLFGESAPAVNSLGPLSEKYYGAQAIIQIGKQEHSLERRWNEEGFKTKVIVDGTPIDAALFSQFLMPKLGLQVLKFPQGDAITGRWTTLTWRSLVRHLYRNERFWDDIADLQPRPDQFACILSFLGVASDVFSQELYQYGQKERELIKLEAQHKQFEETLIEVTSELVAAEEMGVDLTEQSINYAVRKLKLTIERLQLMRKDIIDALNAEPLSSEDALLAEDWAKTNQELMDRQADLMSVRNRIAELAEYSRTVESELEKLQRATKAGMIFDSIKITVCPVCDQKVRPAVDNLCLLCQRPYIKGEAEIDRINFELAQLKEESTELVQTIETLRVEEAANLIAFKESKETLSELEIRLQPLRKAICAVLPPEIANVEQEIGRTTEKIAQWERIRSAVDKKRAMLANMALVENRTRELEIEMLEHRRDVDYRQCARDLETPMNEYLSILKTTGRWDHGKVSVNLYENGFSFKLNDYTWSTALGGTWRGLFLIAYHYALTALSGSTIYPSPGLCILDYPKSFEDGNNVGNTANYTLEPFVDLCAQQGFEGVQIIAASKAVRDIEGANQIILTHRYR